MQNYKKKLIIKFFVIFIYIFIIGATNSNAIKSDYFTNDPNERILIGKIISVDISEARGLYKLTIDDSASGVVNLDNLNINSEEFYSCVYKSINNKVPVEIRYKLDDKNNIINTSFTCEVLNLNNNNNLSASKLIGPNFLGLQLGMPFNEVEKFCKNKNYRFEKNILSGALPNNESLYDIYAGENRIMWVSFQDNIIIQINYFMEFFNVQKIDLQFVQRFIDKYKINVDKFFNTPDIIVIHTTNYLIEFDKIKSTIWFKLFGRGY